MHVAHAVCDAEEWFYYLQGSYERFTYISTTVFMSRYDSPFICYDAKGEGGAGGLEGSRTLPHNDANLKKIPVVWKCPLQYYHNGGVAQ